MSNLSWATIHIQIGSITETSPTYTKTLLANTSEDVVMKARKGINKYVSQ